MRVASRTDKGKVRASNQDALLLQPGEFGLYGVADGMGGHNGGDVASRMAVLLLGRVLEGARPDESLLRGGMEEVNQMIFEEQQKDAPLRGMGTTMTVLWRGYGAHSHRSCGGQPRLPHASGPLGANHAGSFHGGRIGAKRPADP